MGTQGQESSSCQTACSHAPGSSLLGLLANSRKSMGKEHASKPKVRRRMRSKSTPPDDLCDNRHINQLCSKSFCSRCLHNFEEGPHGSILVCSVCRDVVHGGCIYPRLKFAAGAGDKIRDWTCDTCLQEKCLQGSVPTFNYSFCIACAASCKPSVRGETNLVECSLCRASYHTHCAHKFMKFSDSGSTCLSCHGEPDQQHISLKNWSLELVQQSTGRMVPTLRGKRCDIDNPAEVLWRTCEIVHAISPHVLLTRKLTFIHLNGSMSEDLAVQLNLPAQLIQCFRAGFPVNRWRLLIRCAEHGDTSALETLISSSVSYQHPQNTEASDTTKHAIESSGTKMPKFKTGSWTCTDTEALQKSLRQVRPSAPQFWSRISELVGRPAAECQAHAFGRARHVNTPVRVDSVPMLGNHHKNEAKEVDLEHVPKKDGPRRAQKVREFLNSRVFAAAPDFLHVSTPTDQDVTLSCDHEKVQEVKTVSKDNDIQESKVLNLAQPGGPVNISMLTSPSSLEFLGSLHTGCTPRKRKLHSSLGGFLFEECPSQADLNSEFDIAGCNLRDSYKDPVDGTWQPKGLDSFICDTRARRTKLAKHAPSGGVMSFRPRQKLCSDELPLPPRNQFRRAAKLFRKIEDFEVKETLLEMTPQSVVSESEDEMAPIAMIPP